MEKSSVDEIRTRFDGDVERFSNLETGQGAFVDSPLVLDLITEAAASVNPQARTVLDIGCGAGNYCLKLHERLPAAEFHLVDLSANMLARAVERIQAAGGSVQGTDQEDIRQLTLPAQKYDIVMAAAVLHHLRTDDQWRDVFRRVYDALVPGGSFWIADMVEERNPAIAALMKRRYGDYLCQLKDEAYRDAVFAYVDKEDTPRDLLEQLALLGEVGFSEVIVLHKNSCFAAFGGIK